MRNPLLALLAAAALGTAAAHAQWSGWDAEFDENQKEWKEIEAKIPAYPKDGNLVPFDAGPISPHRFFIDTQSLSAGEDGVVRYILVVKTAGGATNITFEGVRCETREQKYYALGQPNGAWTRARNPQWRYIESREVNRHHNVLYQDYLCAGFARSPLSIQQMVQRLKYGAPPKIVE